MIGHGKTGPLRDPSFILKEIETVLAKNMRQFLPLKFKTAVATRGGLERGQICRHNSQQALEILPKFNGLEKILRLNLS